MSKSYTTQTNKSTSTKENLSEKEISFKQKRKNRLEPGYDRVIPANVADDRRLSGDHRDVYSLIRACCSKYGCCNLENWEFADFLNISVSTFQRYLRKLIETNHVVVEIQNTYNRKIWMPEAYHNRERNSKIFSPGQICHGVGQICNDIKDISIDISISKKRSSKEKIPDKPPDNPHAPTAATAFSQKKGVSYKKAPRKQFPFTEYDKDLLRKKWGEKIANPVISRIENIMRENPRSYTTTNPIEDVNRFCAESTRVKSNRFTKKVPEETQKDIEEKNIEAINHILSTYNPPGEIFNCSSDTKIVEVVLFGSDKVLFLDYTKDDFRKKLYDWHEPYRLENFRKKK